MRIRKAISLLLSFVLLFTCAGVSAFAKEAPQVHLFLNFLPPHLERRWYRFNS